uniref:AAA family ATPase n=1 Tax=Jutongia sp. TaxID=2944204 RepID=UPI0030799632
MIIKREKEYRQLREAYEAKENRLIILSGRFGVGKTTLVRQFAQENAGYYYQAAECAPERQKQLLNLCWDRLYDEGRSASEQSAISRIQQTVSRNTYLGIFSEICHRTEGKTLIVMEDFDLIAKNDPDFYRDLVTLMDQEHNLMLLLTVSTWNWREAEAKLEPRSLVGKITDRILLPEFRFLEMVKYFKGLSMVEVVQIYALLGGVPGYLKYWDTGKTIQENV